MGNVQNPGHAGKILQPSRWGQKGTRKQVTRKDSESKMDSDVSATSLKSRTQRSEATEVLRGTSSQPESFPQENTQASTQECGDVSDTQRLKSLTSLLRSPGSSWWAALPKLTPRRRKGTMDSRWGCMQRTPRRGQRETGDPHTGCESRLRRSNPRDGHAQTHRPRRSLRSHGLST